MKQNNDSLMLRLNSLNPGEIRVLLAKYFDKVITLRESIGSKDLSLSQLEVQITPYIVINNNNCIE